MKAGEIYSKTMPFVWAKLLLGLATVVASIVILAILMGIGYLFNSSGVYFFMFLIWLGAVGAINFVLNHYIGYLVKAGHIAVITEAVTTGIIPNNQVEYGKQMVKERFATSNVYFVVDKLVSGAVRQLQRVVEKIGDKASFVPGMNYVTSIAKLFISIALGYIDECCLGYTFLRKKQGAFKSAADGVVIYWQNWKTLLKDAAKTTGIVVALVVGITLAAFLVFGLIFRLLGWNGMIAFLIAALLAWAIKKAFIDSYMMVKMMVSYMEIAPTTKISVDLYEKICGLSSKFKELFNKREEGETGGWKEPEAKEESSQAEGKAVFCGECGAKNPKGTKFCGSCGKAIN